MANINKVILIGRLVADPELRQTQSGIPVTSFTIAINRRFNKAGEQPQADFIDIVCWRQQAEFVSKYFSKGKLICVMGSIQTRMYEDKEGKKRKAVEIQADEVQFAEPKGDGSGGGGGMQRSDYGQQQAPVFASTADDFEELSPDDELPF